VLALGIGANIAVFTVLNGILLRPLPYAHSDRIVKVDFSGGRPYYSMSYANMLQLRDAVGSNLQIGAVLGSTPASVVGPGGRVQVELQEITSDLPAMLGVQPILGRSFRSEENDPGRNRVVLIGEDVWRKLYAPTRNRRQDAHHQGPGLHHSRRHAPRLFVSHDDECRYGLPPR
jgi:hypothetical protein